VLAVVGPFLDQPPPLIEDVAALIGALQGIALNVRQAELDDLAGVVGALRGSRLEGSP